MFNQSRHKSKKINSSKDVEKNKNDFHFRRKLVNKKPPKIWILEKMGVKYQSLAKLIKKQ